MILDAALLAHAVPQHRDPAGGRELDRGDRLHQRRYKGTGGREHIIVLDTYGYRVLVKEAIDVPDMLRCCTSSKDTFCRPSSAHIRKRHSISWAAQSTHIYIGKREDS